MQTRYDNPLLQVGNNGCSIDFIRRFFTGLKLRKVTNHFCLLAHSHMSRASTKIALKNIIFFIRKLVSSVKLRYLKHDLLMIEQNEHRR